jgi:tape measure domain-containing protein
MARLVLGIDARPARQGAQDFDRSAQRVTRSAREAAGATDRVGNSFQRLRPAVQAATGAFAALGGALAIRQLVRYADVATQLNSRLRLVTDTSEELADIQRDLFNLSQETRTGLQNTTNLYVRLQQALQGTGIEQQRVFQVTEAFNKALQLSGSTTAEASAATVQFSQAIAGSVVRAEEFNSLIDASPRLIRALINELEGVDDVGALRQLLEDGELTRERVIEALTNALPRLRGEFEELDRTTSQAFTQLNNALITAIGNIDEQAGATNALNDAIDSIREVVSDPQFQQAAANLTSNLVTISELSLGNLPEIVRLYERLANALSFFGDVGFSPTGLPSLNLSNLGGSGGSSTNQAGRRFDLGPGASDSAQLNEVLQFSRTVGVGSGAGGANVPTPSTRPDGGQDILREQEEARRAFAREQIQRVNRTSDLIAGQRNELREQAERLRADLNPALAEYQERLRQIEASSPFLAEREQLELRIQAGERLNDQIGKTESGLQNAQKAADQLGFSFSSAFEDAIVKWQEFSTVLQGLAQDTLRILVRTQITQPAAGALSDVFGNVFGNIFGGGTGATTGAAVPTSQGGLGQPLPTFAEGGITSGPSIAGERGPEAVVPLPNNRQIPVQMQGGNTNVYVENYSGQEANVQRTRNGNGGEDIRVTIGKEVGRQIASGVHDKPMRSRFGLTPSTGSR